MTAQVRRELKRSDYARRGLVALMALVLVLSVIFLRSAGVFGGPVQVSAQLADAGGSLANGADVKMRGVIVGKVTSVARGPQSGVRVDISIPKDQLGQLPANVVARILPATVFGTSFVDLVIHGTRSAASLAGGAVIPADRTQGTLELQQALDDIDSLVKALGPAQLASAIGSAAQALDGRGAQLGRTIGQLDDYLGKLNPRLPLLRSDIEKLAANLTLADEIAPNLLAATRDGLYTARTIVADQAQIAALLSGSTRLVVAGQAFLDANQARLVRFLHNSAVLLDAVHDNRRAGITDAFATNRLVNARIGTILSHGFGRTLITLDFASPSGYRSAGLGRAVAPWMLVGPGAGGSR